MRIGVPTEIKSNEFRVGLVPGSVRELTARGHEVIVQSGAGAGRSDRERQPRRPLRAPAVHAPPRRLGTRRRQVVYRVDASLAVRAEYDASVHSLDLILILAIGLSAGLALGYITQRLGLSPLVGYLLAGTLVGPYTPGFVADAGLAQQLAEVGVVLLMFGVGLTFKVEELLAVRRVAVPGAIAQSAVATVLGALIARAFGWDWSAGIVFGMALSVASTVVLIRILADNRDLHTATGHIAVGWLVVEDLFTVVALVVLPAVFGPGSAGSTVALALLATAAKVSALIAFTFIVGTWVIPRALDPLLNFGDRHRGFFRHASNDRTEDRAVNGIDNKAGGRAFDPVTEADRAAETAMRGLIRATFPEHGIIGEEFGSERTNAEYVWVLDPIDGTKSFICGMPAWGTLIALLRSGEPVYGLMHQPYTRERFSGDNGAARYRGPSGERVMMVRRCADIANAILMTTSPLLMKEADRSAFGRVEQAVRLSRYGGDCYAYCMLAAGHVDLVIETELKPYDIVPLRDGRLPIIGGRGMR